MDEPRKERRFECAPVDGVEQYQELADDFLQRILGHAPEDCMITDESRLSDFPGDRQVINAKIFEIYGIDVAANKTGNLVEIFMEITHARFD